MRSLALLLLVVVAVTYSAPGEERHQGIEAVTGQPPVNGSEPGFIKGVWNKFTTGVHDGIEKIEGIFRHSNSTEGHEEHHEIHGDHEMHQGVTITNPLS